VARRLRIIQRQLLQLRSGETVYPEPGFAPQQDKLRGRILRTPAETWRGIRSQICAWLVLCRPFGAPRDRNAAPTVSTVGYAVSSLRDFGKSNNQISAQSQMGQILLAKDNYALLRGHGVAIVRGRAHQNGRRRCLEQSADTRRHSRSSQCWGWKYPRKARIARIRQAATPFRKPRGATPLHSA
jgi:hypothetical protein